MTPAVLAEVKARISELEPKERELWLAVQNIDAQWQPLRDAASNAWNPVYRELEALKSLVPAEPQPEKAVPF
jgi:hypothetical protein